MVKDIQKHCAIVGDDIYDINVRMLLEGEQKSNFSFF